jgi:hypothetical protein
MIPTDVQFSKAGLAAIRWVLVLGFFVPGGLWAQQMEVKKAAVTSEQVQAAILNGLNWFRTQQQADGTWAGRGHEGGQTALAVLAMLNAGVEPKDPAVRAGIESLLQVENKNTYVVSLKAQVLAATDLPEYIPALTEVTNWLIQSQRDDGMWGYGGNRKLGDNSNTQFALLGLFEAAKAGVFVPQEVWDRSRTHFVNSQCKDGGWAYRGKEQHGYGSMTAAGLASLYICGHTLNVNAKGAFVDGAYSACGEYTHDIVLAKGLEWFRDNFAVDHNPRKGGSWVYYYLYGMERVGMISGLRMFGRHDWYREGAAELVRQQSRNGYWSSPNSPYKTAFSLLFLAKGNRPVLFQKVQWAGRWNRNIYDLENLTNFIGDKLGKQTTWQTTPLNVPLEDLRVSPILLITGHLFPEFTEEEKKNLRAYVNQAGGTVLFEACCGSPEFQQGARALIRELWPEYPLRPLSKQHPIYSSYFDIDLLYGIEGLDAGCKTSVFLSPNALSCLWELEDVPVYSNLALRLGTNLAAYATGRNQLADKLDTVLLPEQAEENPAAEIPRGVIRIGRLIHNGDYNADANAMVQLSQMLRDQAGMDVITKARHLRPTDEALFEYPVVFMTGHYAFEMMPAELEALGKYLRRGGVLIGESCCGKEEFDKSFRVMVKAIFGNEHPLTPLPREHGLFTGRTGVDVGTLDYRPILGKALNARSTSTPLIEAVVLDGRPVLFYSKYDWSCALEGDRPFSCKGYTDDSGRRLALALFLYALNF